jgi:hypothetical protein
MEELKMVGRALAIFRAQSKDYDQKQVQEVFELEMAHRFLMCPFFEMRIKGMKEFKYINDKICNRIHRKQGVEQA